MAQSSQLEKLLPEGRVSEDFNELEEEDGVWIESDYLGTNSSFMDKLILFLRINWPLIKKPLISFLAASFLFLLFFVPVLNHTPQEPFLYSDIRLPKSVIPHAYRLDFSTSLENASFNGVANIDIEVKEETNYIVIHADKLVLSNVKVTLGKKKWKAHSINMNKEKQYAVILFKTHFAANENYTLSMDYEGVLSDDLSGYYLSKYGPNENPSYLATTQFEPTSARKAFPCFDEPEMKATFQLNMTVGTGLTAISNMNVVKIEKVKKSEKRKFVFAESTRMSTYLVAFIVSSFKSISKKNKNIDISVYARPDQLNSTQYALDITSKILRYYEMLFDIAYPLPKLDLVAIPDFEAGAMENWGLVTFRETALLYDESSSSAINQQYVATVIAHELAHQWFGNLVTMKWWDDLWLNEGFAEFMEYLGTNAAEPEWNMGNEWYYMDVTKAFKSDSSIYTHPIAATVKDPEEISGLFDDISYSKGSSVIRMIRSWVNNINSKMEKREAYANDYFFNRIHTYLLKYAYGNAETHQLWDALESYDKDGNPIMKVSEAMGTFTDQSGYPIVMMKTDLENNRITLSQERYLVNRLGMTSNELDQWMKNATWTIPFSYMFYSNETGQPKLLENVRSITITDDGETSIINLPNTIFQENEGDQPDSSKLVIKANPGQTGFYKVQYEDDSIQIMCEWLKEDLSFMPPIDRAGFLYDISSQLFTGRTSQPEVIMDCLSFLKNENSNIVWQSAVEVLKQLRQNFDINTVQGYLSKFIVSLVNNIANNIGWQENSKDSDGNNNDGKGKDDNNNHDGDSNDENGRKKIIITSEAPVSEIATTTSSQVSQPTLVGKVSNNRELKSKVKLQARRRRQIQFSSHSIVKKSSNMYYTTTDDNNGGQEKDTLHNRSQLRASILELASVVSESNIKNQALVYFNQIRNGTFVEDYDQDVMNVIYSTGVRYGEEDGFNFVLDQYRKETSSQWKDMLKDALASTTLPYLQQRLFELAISDEVREQDTNFLLMRVIRKGGTSVARLCWIFVKEHWEDYFIKRFPTGTAGFSRLLGTIAEYLGNNELFDDMLSWIDGDDDDSDKDGHENIDEKEKSATKVQSRDDTSSEKDKKPQKRIVPSNSKVLVKRGIEFGKASVAWTKNENYGKRVAKWLKTNSN